MVINTQGLQHVVEKLVNLSLIQFGTLSVEFGEVFEEEFYNLGAHLGKLGDSAVIHIENDGKNYLVDTGFANERDTSQKNVNFNERKLKHHLERRDLTFEDITRIFITHWHADHFANLRLFPNARVYCYNPKNELSYDWIAKKYEFEDLLPVVTLGEGDKFAGCEIFPTQGHTELHCSLLLNFMNLKVVIAGDAIVSQSYFDHDTYWSYNAGNLGEQACLAAMNKITEVADYIIPGHGHPFQNYKKFGI